MKYHLTEEQVGELLLGVDDAERIRTVFSSGRSMPRRFYELIAQEVEAIKRLAPNAPTGVIIASNYGVSESTASRWLAEVERLP